LFQFWSIVKKIYSTKTKTKNQFWEFPFQEQNKKRF
jgi:hypothetical protein